MTLARTLYGGLLVGGASRRMGRPKALLEIDGSTLAERAAAALAPHVDRLILLGDGPVPQALAHLERLPDAELPHNELPGSGTADGTAASGTGAGDSAEGGTEAAMAADGSPARTPAGPLAGLLAALRHAPEAAWVLCSCDLPAVRPEAVAWLVAERRPGRRAVVPRLAPGAAPEPLFALYEPTIRPAVEALAKRGVRAPWRLAGDTGVAAPTVPGHLAACWRDADRPEDLPVAAPGKRSGKRRGSGSVGIP